jgi:hypothetical protein
MRSFLNPITLACTAGVIAGFVSDMALLPEPSREGIQISKAEYREQWPFAIQQGRLRCEGAGAIILTASGMDYAVNGMASRRYASIPLRKSTSSPNIGIGPIISRGLTLCKW